MTHGTSITDSCEDEPFLRKAQHLILPYCLKEIQTADYSDLGLLLSSI